MKKLEFDLGIITKEFGLKVSRKSTELDTWLNADGYEITPFQQQLIDMAFEEVEEDGGYWNEEELKIQFVSLIMRASDVAVKNKIKIFYERSLSTQINDFELSVVCDCLLATPLPFNVPDKPYFFLQEFKKKRGEKKDPEAQMLIAMLIAQHLNKNDKTIYGGYLIGHNWHFSTLKGNEYSASRQFDATDKNDLYKIIYILRKIKELVL